MARIAVVLPTDKRLRRRIGVLLKPTIAKSSFGRQAMTGLFVGTVAETRPLR